MSSEESEEKKSKEAQKKEVTPGSVCSGDQNVVSKSGEKNQPVVVSQESQSAKIRPEESQPTETQSQDSPSGISKDTEAQLEEPQEVKESASSLALEGFFAFKLGMTSIYSSQGRQIPVTVLKLKPWVVTQVKTRDKEGYDAVQISLLKSSKKPIPKPQEGHLKKAGISGHVVLLSREIRQPLPGQAHLGQGVILSSFQVGEKLKLTARSKGRGFSGGVKRWNFGGGPAAHGSTFHRQPGSVGNRTWPGRILPGKRLPGHFGHENITVKNVEIVDIHEKESLVLIKGPVPGARNTLVRLEKQAVSFAKGGA